MSWADNIPKQGVLCKCNSNGNILAITSHLLAAGFIDKSAWTPLTPQEVWELMPWNYDVKEATKHIGDILLKDMTGESSTMRWSNKENRFSGGWTYLNFDDAVAWIPLPEHKS